MIFIIYNYRQVDDKFAIYKFLMQDEPNNATRQINLTNKKWTK